MLLLIPRLRVPKAFGQQTKIDSPLVFFFASLFLFSIGDDDNKFLLRLNMTTNKWINTNIPRRKKRRKASQKQRESTSTEERMKQIGCT